MFDATDTSTHQKALRINRDGTKYGTFAEIGAAQEVVRWFFRVGGAAGTVAKSMSAYDMQVSDAIYGKTERYVSRRRLLQMLEHEFALNVERLSGLNKPLFTFASSAATKPNSGHAWAGIRFQANVGELPSQVIVHVVLKDREITVQQEALGIVGVNLIYGAFYKAGDPSQAIASLLDSVSSERIQIDSVQFSGPAFDTIDNRLMALRLVQYGLSEVAAFSADGEVLRPFDALYKKPVLVERGTFRPVTSSHINILQAARNEFKVDYPEKHDELAVFMEITMKNLIETSELDSTDFLARADVLRTIGQPVLITSYPEYHRLVGYLRGYNSEPIALAVGGNTLFQIFDERYYAGLEGGILEGLGKLFRPNVKMYVYPQRQNDGTLIHVESFEPPESVREIYQYLVKHEALETVGLTGNSFSHLSSRDILKTMHSGSDSWIPCVPAPVASLIQERA